MKKGLFLMVSLCLISCYNTTKHFNLEQSQCDTCIVRIAFFKRKDTIYEGNIILNKGIKLKNPHIKYVNVRLYYFQDGELNDFSHPLYFDKKSNKYLYFEEVDYSHTIPLSPMENKSFFYSLWIDIHNLDFTNKYYKSLEQYKKLVKPTDMSSVSPNRPINDDILSYEEPFSEFKRKNPELLEFLTKGDSIELEVLSPVKQKYKFKAEW